LQEEKDKSTNFHELTFTSQQYDYILDKHRYVAFIGGVGSGKTYALCVKGLLKALDNPGSLGCITGPIVPLLRETTKRTFFEICPPELIAYHREIDNIVGIRTPSGKISEILFRSCSEPDSLRGLNLLWAAMDEAAMVNTIEAFDILSERIRVHPESEQQLFISTTPKGFNWVYDLFGPHQTDPEYSLHKCRTNQNIFLTDSFVKSIYNRFSGNFAEQELGGEFVVHEGLVYGDLFNTDVHLGAYPFNPELPVELFWDFGYPNPEAVGVLQQDGKGNVFIIDEIYKRNTLSEDIAAIAKSKPWFKNVVDCICDEARPDSILRLQQLGLPARPSQKGKILDGINKVRALLAIDKTTKQPYLHIDKRCEMLIKEFQMYRWADKAYGREEWQEKPMDEFNHMLDGLRYWVTLKWFNGVGGFSLKKPKPKKRIMNYQRMR
jgi:PBSX family phage terminase large subunit